MKKLFCISLLILALACAFAACDYAPDNTHPHKDGISLEDFTNSDGVHIEIGTGTGHTISYENGQLIINGEKVDYDFGFNSEDVITVEDGYLVVNGVKTEHQVKGEDVITVEDGYVVVNGNRTEHNVNKETIIGEEDGYLVVNGEKTQYKVKTADTITVDSDGYLVVNGVTTEYSVKSTGCNHIWKTVTTAPTCSKGGYDTMTCLLCDKSVKTNETSPIAHTYTTTYSVNDSYHWYQCTVCSATSGKGLHTDDGAGVCTTCLLPISATPGVDYDVSADGTYAEVIGYNGTATQVKIASVYEGLPVKKIYDSAFANNYMLISVVIPDSVETIGSSAFNNCCSLSSVVIGNSVTSISSYAFADCGSLSSVVIPDSVTSISSSAFSGCSDSLFSEYGYGKYLASGDNPYAVLIDIINENMGTYTIHEDTKIIANAAFSGCSRMTSITIPDSVKSIGYYIFDYCNNLSEIEYGGTVSQAQSLLGTRAFNLFGDGDHAPCIIKCSDGTYTLESGE